MSAEKPPIVLVHGAFEDVQVRGHLTARLQADGGKVVAVDRRGRCRGREESFAGANETSEKGTKPVSAYDGRMSHFFRHLRSNHFM